ISSLVAMFSKLLRNEEVDKTVNVACQFLIQNSRSDRQVKYQPKKNSGFLQTVQTPLSIDLPLVIHSRVRDKNLINNLSEVYIKSDYKKILNLEKRVEQSALKRMKETGGFCLPDFVKKGVNIWFAVDNIDLLEDTPTGQNTFHGTVIVINQQAEDGEPVNPPLVLQDNLLSPAPAFHINYLQEQIIKTKPHRYEVCLFGKRKNLTSNDFHHTWALANYFGTDDDHDETTESRHAENEEEQEIEDQEGEVNSETARNLSDSILSVNEPIHKRKKLAKEEVIPTWAATKSLLLSHTATSTPVLLNVAYTHLQLFAGYTVARHTNEVLSPTLQPAWR
ncbi:Hypothetical predicted protein, partial [Paramuricea clavata]